MISCSFEISLGYASNLKLTKGLNTCYVTLTVYQGKLRKNVCILSTMHTGMGSFSGAKAKPESVMQITTPSTVWTSRIRWRERTPAKSGISQPLHCFPEVSQQEVIIRRMKPSTCALDPFPTALVEKKNISVISPLITIVINHSIQAGYVLSVLKTAIIYPNLSFKKTLLRP